MTTPTGTQGTVSVGVVPNTSGFPERLSREVEAAVRPAAAAVERAAERMEHAFEEASRNMVAELSVALAGLQAGADRAADSIERDADRAGDAIGSEIARGVLAANAALALLGDGTNRLTAVGTSALRTAGSLTAVSVAAASAVQGFVALGAALAPAAGILAALPAAVGSVVAVTRTLSVAVDGVGAAISAGLSGDLEAYGEALKELTPNAREFANAIFRLRPGIDELKASVQDNFFAGMAAAFGDLGSQLTAIGKGTLPGLARALGDVADGFLRTAREGALTGGLIEMLRATTEGVGGLKDEAGLLADAFGHLLLVGSKFVDNMYDGIGSLIERFSTWVITASNTGELEQRIRDALAVFSDLGNIARNVGDILSGIFSASTDNGNTLLGTLEAVTRTFAEFVNSTAGQELFGNLFKAASDFTNTLLLPALRTLLPILGEVVSVIAEHLSEALRVAQPYLGSFFKAIGNLRGPIVSLVDRGLDLLVRGLEMVLPLAEELAPVFLDIASAAGGRLLGFLQALWPALEQAWRALEPLLPDLLTLGQDLLVQVAGAVSDLVRALSPLLPIFVEIGAELLRALLPAFRDILEAVRPLLPELGKLAETVMLALLDVVRELTPLLPDIVDAFVQLMPSVVDLVPAVTDLLNAFLPLLPMITELVVLLVRELLPFILPIAEGYMEMARVLAEKLTPAVEAFVDGVGLVIDGFKEAGKEIKEFVEDVSARFERGLERWGEIWDGFKEKVTEAWDGAKRFISDALDTIGNAIGDSGAFFWEKAKWAFSEVVRALEAVFVDAPTWLVNAGKDVIQGFINGIKDRIEDLKGVLREITRLIPFEKGPESVDRVLLTPAGESIMEGLISGIESKVPALKRLLGDLTLSVPGMVVPDSPAALTSSYVPQFASAAAAGTTIGAPVVNVFFEGVVPTEAEAYRTGKAAGAGLLAEVLAIRDARLAVKGLT